MERNNNDNFNLVHTYKKEVAKKFWSYRSNNNNGFDEIWHH